jgi:hypothetical protein
LSDLGRAFEVWPEPEGAAEGLVASTPCTPTDAARVGRDRWLRRSLAVVWALFFAMGGLAVASTWDRLVQGLVQAPIPASSASVAEGQVSAGERAAAEARRLLDGGRPREALAELASIRPAEPVYPFALQLREEARRALERGGPSSR